MYNFIINNRIKKKLEEKHQVTEEEVQECFFNRVKGYLEDTREIHRTLPPTRWFIAETDKGRVLKVVFIEVEKGHFEIKTAYEPNNQEVKIYAKYA